MSLKDIINSVQSKIESAQERGGFSHPVQLIAVTKTHPFSLIQTCYDSGLKTIGENRIQEASQKFESFENMPNISRRFIGHLQSNKVNKCLEMFDTIDSVDSLKLAKKISSAALRLGKRINVLLEINTSGEPQKHGLLPNQLEEIQLCFEEKNIFINGLMTVGPRTTVLKKIRESFIQLRDLQTQSTNQIHKQT